MGGSRRWFKATLLRLTVVAAGWAIFIGALPCRAQGLVSRDLYRFRAVGAVEISADQHRIAYTVQMHDRPGRPYSQVWIMDVSSGQSTRVGGEKEISSGPLWSPDGKWLSFSGGEGDQSGLWVVHADGAGRGISSAHAGHQLSLAGPGGGRHLVAG